MSPTPRVSVILNFYDPRGNPEHLATWTQQQTLPADQFEVIAVTTAGRRNPSVSATAGSAHHQPRRSVSCSKTSGSTRGMSVPTAMKEIRRLLNDAEHRHLWGLQAAENAHRRFDRHRIISAYLDWFHEASDRDNSHCSITSVPCDMPAAPHCNRAESLVFASETLAN